MRAATVCHFVLEMLGMRWSDWYFADQGNLESVRWWTIVVTTVEVATLANVAGATEEPIERYAPDIDIPPPAVLE
jgi:hypothetical protein